ncbi:MAG: hypothetical protein WC455_17925 [Dehalococcoidia bacterium]|jgi:hypothetical protein
MKSEKSDLVILEKECAGLIRFLRMTKDYMQQFYPDYPDNGKQYDQNFKDIKMIVRKFFDQLIDIERMREKTDRSYTEK